MTTPLDYRPTPARRSSPAGVASVVLGAGSLVVYFLLLSMRRTPGTPGLPSWVAVAVFAAVVGLPAAGVVLGVVSLRTPARRRGLALAGVVFNGLLLALPLIAVALFLMLGRR